MAMLEVNHLAIQFGGLRAVDGFNVSIEKGQLYGLNRTEWCRKNNNFQPSYRCLQTDRGYYQTGWTGHHRKEHD